jgi:hypothetical protein
MISAISGEFKRIMRAFTAYQAKAGVVTRKYSKREAAIQRICGKNFLRSASNAIADGFFHEFQATVQRKDFPVFS